jgi:AmiR/NasT family two-component response regulator
VQAETNVDARAALGNATRYLVASHRCSEQEAQEWIQQEARAKKTSLRQVARAIIDQKPVRYRYSVPV